MNMDVLHTRSLSLAVLEFAFATHLNIFFWKN
jgi:hypothetical protein